MASTDSSPVLQLTALGLIIVSAVVMDSFDFFFEWSFTTLMKLSIAVGGVINIGVYRMNYLSGTILLSYLGHLVVALIMRLLNDSTIDTGRLHVWGATNCMLCFYGFFSAGKEIHCMAVSQVGISFFIGVLLTIPCQFGGWAKLILLLMAAGAIFMMGRSIGFYGFCGACWAKYRKDVAYYVLLLIALWAIDMGIQLICINIFEESVTVCVLLTVVGIIIFCCGYIKEE